MASRSDGGLARLPGNRSTWISEGGYEPVAGAVWQRVNVDTFFCGVRQRPLRGFRAAARIRPGHQQVVLGLITTKNGELENPQR